MKDAYKNLHITSGTITMPTPTTSPLIEGIIESFEEKLKDLLSDYDFDDRGETGVHYFGYRKLIKEENDTILKTIHTIADFGNIKEFLLSSLQKVALHYESILDKWQEDSLFDTQDAIKKTESETVERCLKALPEPKDCQSRDVNDKCEEFGWNTYRLLALSAIKKEFKRE